MRRPLTIGVTGAAATVCAHIGLCLACIVSGCVDADPVVITLNDGDLTDRADWDDATDTDLADHDSADHDSADHDTADSDASKDVQDTDVDTTTDTDFSADKDEAVAGGVELILTNQGPHAAYVQYLWPGSSGHLGISLQTVEGEPVNLGAGCVTNCEDCEPIMCEAALDEVVQVLPGAALTWRWDGSGYEYRTCENASYGTVQCAVPRTPQPGAYQARFCSSALLDTTQSSNLHREPNDRILWTRPLDPTCITIDLTYTGKTTSLVEKSFSTTLPAGMDHKVDGYCGRTWGFSLFAPVELIDYPARIMTGRSIPLTFTYNPMVPMSEPPSCYLLGDVAAYASDEGRQINVAAGAFISAGVCDDTSNPPYHTAVIAPLRPGDYSINVETGFSSMPITYPLTVSACNGGCPPCPMTPTASLGDACAVDCECRDKGAACSPEGVCVRYCLSDRDCEADQRCAFVADSHPGRGQCAPLAGDACTTDRDCGDDKGVACAPLASDQDGANHCLPDRDTRNLDLPYTPSKALHCGCDAECPGAQRCVTFPINFTEGFCALVCRDDRDCPTAWRCLGMTQSGLEAVCTPPLDD